MRLNRYALVVASLCAFVVPKAAQADVLVGWETWASGGEAPSVVLGDITGSSQEFGDWRENNAAASTDGTFGTLAGASSTTGPASSGTYLGQTPVNGQSIGSYNFTITAGAEGLILESFHFDARRKRSNSATTWTVSSVAGDIELTTIQSGSLGSALGGVGPTDHLDFDIDLTGLTDNVLAAGQTATFKINFTGGGSANNNDQHTYLDNVAIAGTVVPIPEPTSLALLGLGSLLIARRRQA